VVPAVLADRQGRLPELPPAGQGHGYSALLVTLDTGTIGWRPSDLDRGFLPFLKGEGLANYFSDPAFRAKLAKPVRGGPDRGGDALGKMFPNLAELGRSCPSCGTTGAARSCSRHHLDRRRQARGRARGGRHRRVEPRRPSGGRGDRRTRALPAIGTPWRATHGALRLRRPDRLGRGEGARPRAKAVLLGRPFLYGLALAGQAGVEHVLRCLLAELDLTLALSGYANHRELNRDSVLPA